jgi:hypothetical protein
MVLFLHVQNAVISLPLTLRAPTASPWANPGTRRLRILLTPVFVRAPRVMGHIRDFINALPSRIASIQRQSLLARMQTVAIARKMASNVTEGSRLVKAAKHMASRSLVIISSRASLCGRYYVKAYRHSFIIANCVIQTDTSHHGHALTRTSSWIEIYLMPRIPRARRVGCSQGMVVRLLVRM